MKHLDKIYINGEFGTPARQRNHGFIQPGEQ